jgi:carbon storage regulator
MLVLSRHKNESIVIGNGIVVTVLSTGGRTVRLGISAPPEVPVHRQEVHQRLEFQSDLKPVADAVSLFNREEGEAPQFVSAS